MSPMNVHPQVAALVVLAARVVGLDIAGIDLVAQDISKPLYEQGGAVVEVNAGPGLLMHLKPAIGKPRPVGKDIVAHLFDPNNPRAFLWLASWGATTPPNWRIWSTG
jgi:cyanophycin synthetase